MRRRSDVLLENKVAEDTEDSSKVKVTKILKGKGAKAVRLAANSKKLSGCVQEFLKGLDALELLDLGGEKVTAAELKKFGEHHVELMANQMDELMNAPGAEKLSLDQAMMTVLKRFESMHAEWFKAQKGYFIVNFQKLNGDLGLIKRMKYNINDYISASFGSYSHKTGHINKGSIAEKVQIFYRLLMKDFIKDLSDIGEKYKIGANVGKWLTDKEKIVEVWDAYRNEATEKGNVAVEIAQALRKLNDNTLRQFRQYGIVIPDLKNFFFTHQIHNSSKMQTPNSELLMSELGMTKREFKQIREIPGKNVAQTLWLRTITPKIDWARSFEGAKKDTAAQKKTLLVNMWEDIMGTTVAGKGMSQGRFNSFPSYVRGKQRQIFFLDGKSYAEYNFHYGTPNLLNHIFNFTRSTSKNLAVFEKFGPNPEYVFNKIKQELSANNISDKKVANDLERMQDWFDYYTKNTNSGHDMTTSRIVQLVKFLPSIRVITTLGLNSLPDFWIQAANIKNLKLGDASGRVLEGLNNYFFKSSMEKNAKLNELFNGADTHFTQALLYQSKVADVNAGLAGSGISKLYYQMSRWGGIDRLDETLKLGIQGAYSEKIARSFDLKWNELDDELRFKLEQHQFTPQEWDGIRANSKNLVTVEGKSYFAPFEVAKMSDNEIGAIYGLKSTSKKSIDLKRNDLALKGNAFLAYQAHYVTPELNAPVDKWVKKFMGQNSNNPTVQIIFQLMYQFKNWSLNFSMNTLKRIVQQEHKTIPQRAYDMAYLMIPLGGIYTALNYFRLQAQNRKFPGKKGENLAWTLTKEFLIQTKDQLGILNILANQFTSQPRGLFPSAGFYSGLGRDIAGIVSPGQRYTRGDYLSRLLGEFADTTVPTEVLYNWVIAQYLESDNYRKHFRGK